MAITDAEAVTAVKEWLAVNWDPDLTVFEWWERLGAAGWSAPGLPESSYGHGLARSEVVWPDRKSSGCRRPSLPSAPWAHPAA
jgi:hypothetical protein